MTDETNEATIERILREKYEAGFSDGVGHVDEVKEQVLELLSKVEALVSGFGSAADEEVPLEDPVFECSFKKQGIRATMVIREGNCVIRKGSESVGEWRGKSKSNGQVEEFRDLRSRGILVAHPDKEGRFVFASHYAAGKPSRAASLICGRSTNGRLELKETKTGKSYGELEAKRRGESEDRGTTPVTEGGEGALSFRSFETTPVQQGSGTTADSLLERMKNRRRVI